MDEYPDFYPPFMRDFHDQKTLIKSFYTWLIMMDNRQERACGRKFDKYHKRRIDRCSWIDFHVLVLSFLDFLHYFGWVIYQSRKRNTEITQDVAASAQELLDLQYVWYSLIDPNSPLSFPPEKTQEILTKWDRWRPYFPQDVLDILETQKDPQP